MRFTYIMNLVLNIFIRKRKATAITKATKTNRNIPRLEIISEEPYPEELKDEETVELISF